MPDDLIDKPPINKPLVVVAIAVFTAAIGGWAYWHARGAPPAKLPSTAASDLPATAPAPAPEEKIEHPVPSAPPETAKATLPALGDSDTAIAKALGEAAHGTALMQYLVPESVIRHIVVTVDNLMRQKVAPEKRPFAPAPGTLRVDGDELHATLNDQNFERYRPMIEAIRNADTQSIAAVYLRFYPLFQQAYLDLGYPNGYFNDRLVQVIDMLLATPQLTGGVELTRPHVMYTFDDPALESRPAGQKMLIRMGPDNAAVVKAKLAELRAIITAAPPKH